VRLKRSAISNSGPLIHLAKIGMLELMKIYDVVITEDVREEVVDKGKEKGFSDAFLIDDAIKSGWIKVINVDVEDKFLKIAKVSGLHDAEIGVVYYAYKKGIIALLDDDAARVFARGLGITVRGSLGLILEGVKNKIISYESAVKALDDLSEIMYLSSDVYREVLKALKKLKHQFF